MKKIIQTINTIIKIIKIETRFIVKKKIIIIVKKKYYKEK